VFGVAHPYLIETVVAAVVPRAGQSPDVVQLIAFCRDRLAGYKTPKHIVLVEALPKNASGKVLKRELRDEHARLAQGSA
jgi:fatty-acyl-CoA synthase